MARGSRSFIRDQRGVAAVELALLLPVAFFMLGLAVFGGEGLGIQRKATLAARTVADLVGQTATSGSVNSSGGATLNQSTLDYYLSLTSLVMYPYDSSNLNAEISEISVAPGSTTGTVVWSEAYNGGTARPVGQTVTLATGVSSAAGSCPSSNSSCLVYLLLGETQYAYTPLGVANVLGAMSISGSIFMIPRAATQISINWGS
jgi:Flp pilus assembly protein TadG